MTDPAAPNDATTTIWPRRQRVVCECGIQLTAGADPATPGRCSACVLKDAEESADILKDIMQSFR